MATLGLTLFGSPAVITPGAPERKITSSKTLAIVTYLALERGPHARETLAALLWGESTQNAARASLRQALKQLRDTVGPAVRIDRKAVALVSSLDCDVTAFLAAAERDPESAAAYDVPRFLEGLSIRGAPGFEEWVERKRAVLLARYHGVLRSLARTAFAKSRWREAAEWADRWLASDRLCDEAARIGIEARYLAGRRSEALQHFAAYRERLASDLQAEPSAAMLDLAKRIEGDRRDRVSSPRGALESRGPKFLASLVGRERPWRQLVEVWSSVAAGAGRVVLIEGEAGIGKTRLAEEFLRWAMAEGATTLRGRGYDPKAGIPYGPVVEALRGALDAPGLGGAAREHLTEATRVLPELRRRFPGLPPPAAPTDATERWRLFEAIAQLLLAVAEERPTALLIDDLQWCDGETCALLHFLSRRFETSPVALLATVTQGEIDGDAPAARLVRALRVRSRGAVISLDPLSEAEVWQMIREMARISAPAGGRRFAGKVFEVTDGNPFYVIEVAKTLFAQRVLAVEPSSGQWVVTDTSPAGQPAQRPLPATVRDAIGERVARLNYELRDLLATIAMAGPRTHPDLLSHVHGISRLRAAALADALVERQLVVAEEGVYRCAHALISDVVRDKLTAARRLELHRAIALSLEEITAEIDRGKLAGEIARHAVRGGEHAMAYRYAIAASQAAIERYAFDEALSWLDLAAGSAAAGEQTDEVNRRTADVLERAGWKEPPLRPRRPGTPALGIQKTDLDLPLTEPANRT